MREQMMAERDFSLRFRLAESGANPERWLHALAAAGCDDATIGIGQPGRIALDFTRAAVSIDAAIESAVADVKRAVPGAELVEVRRVRGSG